MSDLEKAKRTALATIERGAETLRLAVLPHPGQAFVYERKRQEAIKATSENDPKPNLYPFLAAEIGRTGGCLHGIASRVLSAAYRADNFLAKVERTRMDAAALVGAAQSATAIDEILSTIPWPMLEVER